MNFESEALANYLQSLSSDKIFEILGFFKSEMLLSLQVFIAQELLERV